jgi:hypothetical protein
MTLTREDVQTLEAAGKALLRHHENELGTRVLVLALLHRPPVFACNVDESAGMAEVVELQNYSRCVK